MTKPSEVDRWEIFKNEESPLYEVICWRDGSDSKYDVKHSCDDPEEAQATLDRLSGKATPGDSTEGKRFCGRCQSWVPAAIEIHFCVKAPRKIGYEWYEPDTPARAKNDIVTTSTPAKRGKLIQRFPAEK